MIEGVLVAPLFFLLIFSTFEFGLAFRQYLTVSTASRNGTRSASAAGNFGDADYLTLQAIKSSTTALNANELTYIVIFKATGPTSSLENDTGLKPCMTASVAGVCNRYVVSDLSRPASDFGNCPGVTTGPDHYWCPTTRNVSASGALDYVGVYIHSRYKAATGIFGKSFDFGEQTIYRMEPQTR
jgi:Flp pilus assembly protein TadG